MPRSFVTFRVEGRPIVAAVDPDADDSISVSIRKHDPSVFGEFRDIAPFVTAGSTVLDVGAHVGLASLYFHSRGHRVVSFEASPANAAVLRDARDRNGPERWTVVESAVSDRADTVTFLSAGPEGHIVADASATGTTTVSALALDAWLDAHNVGPIGLVKIDIEGAEVQALHGARGLLERDDAPALFIESNGHCLHWFGETPETLRSLLAQFGYQLFGIRTKRPLRPTSFYPVAPQALQGRGCVNLFCVKDVAALAARGARIERVPPGRAALLRDVERTLRGDNRDERAYILRALAAYPGVAAEPAVARAIDVARAAG